jgi:fumarylpyruvate hydrolase
MTLAFAPPPQITVPVSGSGLRFPVNRIFCVGRNYADHVKEMGNDAKGTPIFFMKPADAIVLDGQFPYPTVSKDVHHEIELVVALGPDARIFGYAVGIDMTRRDLQAMAKSGGKPWEQAKSFDKSAPIGAIMPMTDALAKGAILLDVNGTRRQSADLADMIWSVEEILVELRKLFTLKPGDLIYTGTPAGVGAVQRGDHMHGEIAGIGTLDVTVI